MFPHLDRAWSFGVLSDIKVWSTIPRSSKSQPSHLPHKSSLSLLVTIPSFPPSLHPIHSSFKRIHLVFCSFLASIKAVSKAPKCNRPRSRNCNASTAKGQVKSMEGATLLLGGMLRSDLFWGGKNQRRTCGTWMMSHGLVKSKKWRTLHTGGGGYELSNTGYFVDELSQSRMVPFLQPKTSGLLWSYACCHLKSYKHSIPNCWQ